MSAPSQDYPARWPMATPLQTRDNNFWPVRGAVLINAYAEYDGAIKEYNVYKRPGISLAPIFSISGTHGNGIFSDTDIGQTAGGIAFGSYIFSVVDHKLYRGTTAKSITLNHLFADDQYWFCVVPTIGRLLFFTNGAYGFVYDYNLDTTSQVTDPDFPVNLVRGTVCLNGVVYVMDNMGAIYNSAVNDPTTWAATDVIRANAFPDGAQYLGRQNNYIVALKTTSVQVFQDVGASPGSPLAPVSDALFNIGCLSGYTVAQMDSSLLWVSTSTEMGIQVAMMENLHPGIVSTPDVERLLRAAAFGVPPVGSIPFYGSCLKQNGHRFYILNLLTTNLTLVYDIDQKLWHVWTDKDYNYWNVKYIVTYVTAVTSAQALMTRLTGGDIYAIDASYKLDVADLIPVDIYTTRFDGDVDRRKMLNQLRFNGDQVEGGVLLSRFNDHDYAVDKWTQFREVDMGKERPVLINNGTFRKRSYNWRYVQPLSLRLRSVDLQMDIGTL